MKILVLVVDRDNDFGEKAGVRSPIIGRRANLDAAVKLALKDPEDSDTNGLFSAISLYDRLKREKKSAEIATICGDSNVGRDSDTKLAREIDFLIKKVKPKSVYLVSDGAEDDYIIPIISSRIKIDHVKRVYVRQNRSIESSYYLIAKALKDEKFRKKITVPIALGLMFYGILVGMTPFLLYVILNGIVGTLSQTNLLSQFAGGTFIALLGLYMLSWAYAIDDKLVRAVSNYKKNLERGSATPYFTTVASVLVLFGMAQAWDAWTGVQGDLTKHILYFIAAGMWWWIFGVLLHEGGYVVDAYSMKGIIPKSFWIITFSTTAMGLILWAVLDSVKLVLGYAKLTNTVFYIYLSISLAAFLVISAVWVSRSTRKKARIEAQWRK